MAFEAAGGALLSLLPLPVSRYENRDFSDQLTVLRTVFEIDTRDEDQSKCFRMYENLLSSVYQMPETMQGDNI